MDNIFRVAGWPHALPYPYRRPRIQADQGKVRLEHLEPMPVRVSFERDRAIGSGGR